MILLPQLLFLLCVFIIADHGVFPDLLENQNNKIWLIKVYVFDSYEVESWDSADSNNDIYTSISRATSVIALYTVD